jgi:hypothetical protein
MLRNVFAQVKKLTFIFKNYLFDNDGI